MKICFSRRCWSDGISGVDHSGWRSAGTEVNASVEGKESRHEGHPKGPRDAMVKPRVGGHRSSSRGYSIACGPGRVR